MGSLVWFFGTEPPLGYLVCDGRTVSQFDYPALFQVLGTTFGPADESAFTLPNMLGAFVRGWNGGGSGPDTGRVFGSIQQQSTAAPLSPVNITTVTSAAGTHNHAIQVPTVGYAGVAYGSQREAIAVPTSQMTSQGRPNNGTIRMLDPDNQGDSNSTPVVANGSHTHNINGTATLTGGDLETRPYNIALLPCVKF